MTQGFDKPYWLAKDVIESITKKYVSVENGDIDLGYPNDERKAPPVTIVGWDMGTDDKTCLAEFKGDHLIAYYVVCFVPDGTIPGLRFEGNTMYATQAEFDRMTSGRLSASSAGYNKES